MSSIGAGTSDEILRNFDSRGSHGILRAHQRLTRCPHWGSTAVSLRSSRQMEAYYFKFRPSPRSSTPHSLQCCTAVILSFAANANNNNRQPFKSQY